MADANLAELKEKLVSVYRRYLLDPYSDDLKEEMFNLYSEFSGIANVLKKEMALSLNWLLNLSDESYARPPPKSEIAKLLSDLERLEV